MEGNAHPINIFSLIFTDELTDNLVEWTSSNYAEKKQLQPDIHRMKWTDTYPDEIRAFLAILIIMNDMIIELYHMIIFMYHERNCFKDHHT